jgi:hypothetical protein
MRKKERKKKAHTPESVTLVLIMMGFSTAKRKYLRNQRRSPVAAV